ncbi:hypothetical protein GAPWKB30_0848 [Gilliamella apicola]|nr:hypothetical protein GAPWKB30_0848 [Gilliamella apicola]
MKHIIAWLLIIAWCVGSYLLGHAYFSMPTTIGMVILTFFFMSMIHFGALDL